MPELLEKLGITQNVLIAAVVAVIAIVGLVMAADEAPRRPAVSLPADSLIDVALLGPKGRLSGGRN